MAPFHKGNITLPFRISIKYQSVKKKRTIRTVKEIKRIFLTFSQYHEYLRLNIAD